MEIPGKMLEAPQILQLMEKHLLQITKKDTYFFRNRSQQSQYVALVVVGYLINELECRSWLKTTQLSLYQ